MSKTLFISDLDGTLLNSRPAISDVTAATLGRLIAEQGLLFSAATARTPATAIPLTEAIGIQIPMVVMSGAALWDNRNWRFISHTHIPADEVARIIAIMKAAEVNPYVYHIADNILQVQHAAELNTAEKRFIDQRSFSPLKHFSLGDVKAVDASLLFAIDSYDRMLLAYNWLRNEVDCEIVFSRDIYDPTMGNLEIFASGTSKASGVALLRSIVEADKVVAFGDNRNDIAMLQAADVAVVVENGCDEAKAIADHIIGSNDTDSVARWIADNYHTI